jgi:hypothetical protein
MYEPGLRVGWDGPIPSHPIPSHPIPWDAFLENHVPWDGMGWRVSKIVPSHGTTFFFEYPIPSHVK